MADGIVGRLDDGTPCFAPIGELLVDGDQVCCHLCGRWFRSVASHLRMHGWTKPDYVRAFGLEFGNPLCGEATRKLRAAALTGRQAIEPAIRAAQREARARARDGGLTRAAAEAALGRPHPAQRRVKTLAALDAIDPGAIAAGNRRRAALQRERTADAVAGRFGFADFETYVRSRLDAGLSLAAISREAELHKDWLTRHLPKLVPGLAPGGQTLARADARWAEPLSRMGFRDVATYLRRRHVVAHRSVAAIANEVGLSRSVVDAAMARHGIVRSTHATSRAAASRREHEVARAMGFASVAAYIDTRRSRGVTWRAMAGETGQPETWLRRRAGSTGDCAAHGTGLGRAS